MSAPAGHDPNQSLLEGGTAVITPVMGGGGTPHYDWSLLLPRDKLPAHANEVLDTPNAPTPDPLDQPSIMAAAAIAGTEELKASGDSVRAGTAARMGAAIQALRKRPHTSTTTAATATPKDNYNLNLLILAAALGSVVGLGIIRNILGNSGVDALRNSHPTPATPEAVQKAVDEIRAYKQQNPGHIIDDLERSKYSTKQVAPTSLGTGKVLPKPRKINSIQHKSDLERLQNEDAFIEFYGLENIKEIYNDLMNKKAAVFSLGDKFRDSQRADMDEYERALLERWNRTEENLTYPESGRYTKFKTNEIIRGFSRLTYVLPITTQSIIILPPIRGNTEKFLKCLQTLDNLGIIEMKDGVCKIKPGVVIICSAPFYAAIHQGDSEKNKMTNLLLLAFVMAFEKANPDQFFVLSENTSENYLVGSYFNTIRSLPGPYHKIINMLEPSYILYPYIRKGLEGILVSAAVKGEMSLPSSKGTFDLPKLYSRADFGKMTTVVYKPDIDTESATGYLIFRALDTKTPFPTEKASECTLASYNLTGRLDDYHPTGVINTDMGDVITVIRLQGGKVPLCKMQELDNFEYPNGPNKFVSSPEAVVDGIRFFPLEANGKIYQIRISNMSGDPVYMDRLNEKYTDGEADFLNSLNLRPYMMSEIFSVNIDINGQAIGTRWQEWVANFLSNMVLSKCFTDENLMTRRECMMSRDFMNRVFNYFVNNNLRSDILQEMEEAQAEDEINKFEQNKQDIEEIERQINMQQPGYNEAAPVRMQDFSKLKKRWGTLDIFRNYNNNTYTTYVIMVHKETGDQQYRTIAVPFDEYPDETDANVALQMKLDNLKGKYPGFLFLY